MICSSWHTGPMTRNKSKRKNEYLDRAVAQKSRVLKRINKKDSVLVKHLAWLRELQENKSKLNEEKKIEEERKLERKRLIKANRHNNTKRLIQLATKSSSPEAVSEDEDFSLITKRPAWCKSENEGNTSDNTEVHDEHDLLDFIQQLNFDRFNQDLELQTLIGQVKNRIKSLEKEKRKDDKMLQACTDVSTALPNITFHERLLRSDSLCELFYHLTDRAKQLRSEPRN